MYIHTSVQGHLGYFHLLVIVTDTAINIGVQICVHISAIFLHIYLKVELLGHTVFKV